MNRSMIQVTTASLPDVYRWLSAGDALPQLPRVTESGYLWLPLCDRVTGSAISKLGSSGEVVLILHQTGMQSSPKRVWQALDYPVQQAMAEGAQVWLVLTGGLESSRLALWDQWLQFATPGKAPMRVLWLGLLADLLLPQSGPFYRLAYAVRHRRGRGRV